MATALSADPQVLEHEPEVRRLLRVGQLLLQRPVSVIAREDIDPSP